MNHHENFHFPSGMFTLCKTNTTTITSIVLHLVSSKVHFLDQAQVHQPAYTTALLLNECIPSMVRMRFVLAHDTLGESPPE
jgi:hypothetical protein